MARFQIVAVSVICPLLLCAQASDAVGLRAGGPRGGAPVGKQFDSAVPSGAQGQIVMLDVSSSRALSRAMLPRGVSPVVIEVTNDSEEQCRSTAAASTSGLESLTLVFARGPEVWPGNGFKIVVLRELASRASPEQLLVVADASDTWFRPQRFALPGRNLLAAFAAVPGSPEVVVSVERGFMVLSANNASSGRRLYHHTPEEFPSNPEFVARGVADHCDQNTTYCSHWKMPNAGLVAGRAAAMASLYQGIWAACPACRGWSWQPGYSMHISEQNIMSHHLLRSGMCGGLCALDYRFDLFHTFCGASACGSYRRSPTEDGALVLEVNSASGERGLIPVGASAFHAPGNRFGFQAKCILRSLQLADEPGLRESELQGRGSYMKSRKFLYLQLAASGGGRPLKCPPFQQNTCSYWDHHQTAA